MPEMARSRTDHLGKPEFIGTFRRCAPDLADQYFQGICPKTPGMNRFFRSAAMSNGPRANPALAAAADLVLEAVQKWRSESIGMAEFDRRTRFLHELEEITAAAIRQAEEAVPKLNH